MAQKTIREQMVECADQMENGMIKVRITRDIWQNNLIWWLCKSVKLLLDERLKETRR